MASPRIQLWDKEFWNKGARRQLYQDYAADEENARLQADLARQERAALDRQQEAKDERTWRDRHAQELAKLQSTLAKDEIANRYDLEGNMQKATDVRRHGLSLDLLGKNQEFTRERDSFDLENRPDVLAERRVKDALTMQAAKEGMPGEDAKIAAQNARAAQIAEEVRAQYELSKAIANNPLLKLTPGENPLDPNSKLERVFGGGGGGGARVAPGTRIPKRTGTNTPSIDRYRQRYGY